MKRLRILALVPTGSVPPESLEDMSEKQIEDLKMEYDVLTALRKLEYIDELVREIAAARPQVRS
ncbi:MAG: hypothetical protein ACYSUM_14150, partial [Planctomycetota bacterium]